MLPEDTTQDGIVGLLGEWDGSEKYNRVCRIGKGAFATVYKVTAKFDGKPYAAKELDKRKFMKNGVLDQKVENEMKIMQRAKHVSSRGVGTPSLPLPLLPLCTQD
jgi:serine/threonine protein kinase